MTDDARMRDYFQQLIEATPGFAPGEGSGGARIEISESTDDDSIRGDNAGDEDEDGYEFELDTATAEQVTEHLFNSSVQTDGTLDVDYLRTVLNASANAWREACVAAGWPASTPRPKWDALPRAAQSLILQANLDDQVFDAAGGSIEEG